MRNVAQAKMKRRAEAMKVHYSRAVDAAGKKKASPSWQLLYYDGPGVHHYVCLLLAMELGCKQLVTKIRTVKKLKIGSLNLVKGYYE